jgi:hypothetical protein
MWVIVTVDPEDENYPMPDVLLNEDGTAKMFRNEAEAWRFMRRSLVQYELPPEMLDFDTIGIARVH